METEQIKAQSPAEQPSAAKTSTYWMLLPFRFALKLLIFAVFIIYVFIGTSATEELYTRTMYRAQDISTIPQAIDEAEQNGGDRSAVTALLKARPLAETDKLVEIITPKSPPLESSVFFDISQREFHLNRPEEALFWMQLGRYRLRYDILRCGAEADSVKAFDKLLNAVPSTNVDDLLRAHPELLKKSLQRVLDFDAKYPAHDNPARVCKILTPELPADEINWEGYRQMLRKHTEDFLNAPDNTTAPVEKK